MLKYNKINARVCLEVLNLSKLNFSESMTVEFKGDEKKLSDDIIIDSVVAFANTSGGKLYRIFSEARPAWPHSGS